MHNLFDGRVFHLSFQIFAKLSRSTFGEGERVKKVSNEYEHMVSIVLVLLQVQPSKSVK